MGAVFRKLYGPLDLEPGDAWSVALFFADDKKVTPEEWDWSFKANDKWLCPQCLLKAGLGSGVDATVNTLTVDKQGTVYAGGTFTKAGGSTANHIAVWDGSAWSTLSSGLTGHGDTVFTIVSNSVTPVVLAALP